MEARVGFFFLAQNGLKITHRLSGVKMWGFSPKSYNGCNGHNPSYPYIRPFIGVKLTPFCWSSISVFRWCYRFQRVYGLVSFVGKMKDIFIFPLKQRISWISGMNCNWTSFFEAWTPFFFSHLERIGLRYCIGLSWPPKNHHLGSGFWPLILSRCYTWRIIPVSKWLVSPIYKPCSPFGRGITILRGLNHGS